jgi:SAM-dependent methyltransferase
LEKAEANVEAEELQDRIKIQREDILALSFEDSTCAYILCWGVLMHIPDLEKAISVLSRVLKPVGMLIISEGNMYSFQSVMLRSLRRLLGKGKGAVKKTPADMEYWSDSAAAPPLTRQANIGWSVKGLRSKGFVVVKHVAGQFTELYTRVSFRLVKGLIHSFNRFWFRYVKAPHFAFGNIIIVRKEN